MLRQPNFWTTRSVASVMLLPLSWVYGLAATLDRLSKKPQALSVPTIGIGNVTAGGAGKTPTTIAITKLLQQRGHTPHILSRGYGAKTTTPIRVSNAQHTSNDVGDEALLLAKQAPTWVCPSRIASGDAAVAAGANIVVCDDALQHHRLHKDINLLVIDGAYGIGNGFLLPAGPLRESFASALRRSEAIIYIGEGPQDINPALPVFTAKIHAVGDTSWLKESPLIAFAGIARPKKFYDTLRALGTPIAATHDFPDHHVFTEEELKTLTDAGTAITTEKDWVRLPAKWQARIKYLPVELVFDDSKAVADWLEKELHA